MNTFKLSLCLILITVICGEIYSQDSQNSVGPAPYVYRTAPENPMFDAAIGTRAFTQISSTPTFQFGKSFMESCTITNIGAPFTMTFPGGLVFWNGVVFTYNQSSPFQLWQIDTVTGTHTLRFNLNGLPQANLTGMCWDSTTMYALTTNMTQSQISRVNMTTGAFTPIGAPSAVCAGGITLLGRSKARYSLFVLDIVADSLYKVNKTTGVFTSVGPLGQNINFGQDGSVDPNDRSFYAMTYTTGPELRKVDTATGLLGPVLCTYSAQATGLACVSSTPPPPPAFNFCRTGINVPINDHSTARDSVNVILGSGGIVTDVNVRINNVTHTWDSDLTFYLQKGNIGAVIINKVGGSGDNFTDTYLDDSGIDPIASGTAPFTDTFIPSSPLAPFIGPWTTGYWKLAITDTATGDTGALTAWCLVIQYTFNFMGGIHTIEIPNYYSLSQNYPNPFNPVTSIKFTMPQGDNVKLAVFDILGREVKTLVNEFRNAGVYEVSFDASALSSGAYFYRIEAGDYSATKKMLIIK